MRKKTVLRIISIPIICCVFVVLTPTFYPLAVTDDHSINGEPHLSEYELSSYNLTTDRDVYYPNETIHINASWDLLHDNMSSNGKAYLEVRIYDDAELLWNSDEYNETGYDIQHNLSVPIQDLVGKIDEDKLLTVTLFYYAENSFYPPISDNLNRTKEIKVIEYGNSTIKSLGLERITFFSNESLIFNLSWDLFYHTEYESSYIQVRIVNTSHDLVWNSSRISERGKGLSLILNVSIRDVFGEGGFCVTLRVGCFYFYKSLIRPIQRSETYLNTTLNIIKCEVPQEKNTQTNVENAVPFVLFFGITIAILILSGIFAKLRKKEILARDIVIEY